MFNPCRADEDREELALEDIAAIQPAMMGLWFPGIGRCVAETMLPIGAPVSAGCRRRRGVGQRAGHGGADALQSWLIEAAGWNRGAPKIPRGCYSKMTHKGLWVCCQGTCRLAVRLSR